VAQHGADAAGLDRGEEVPLQPDVRVPDGVDAGMQPVQAPVVDANTDVLARQAARAELVQR
jgi:hypothetical protein